MPLKKSNLDLLRDLISRLTDAEMRNLRQYLCCFDPNFDQGHKVKTLELLDIISASGDTISEKDAIRIMYPDGNANAFKFLRLRLTDKIYESLLLDVNISPSRKYSDSARIKIELRKNLLLAEILWGRGHTDPLPRLLDRIIRKAIQMELFEIGAEALRLKQQFEGFRKGQDAFLKIQDEIEYAEGMDRAIKSAKQIHSLHQIHQRTFSMENDREGIIGKLNQLAKKFPCGHTHYYYLLVSHHSALAQKQFDIAAQVSQHLLNLFETYPAISSSRRKGIVYATVSEQKIMLGKWEEAIHFATLAQKSFPADSVNFDSALELEFYAKLLGEQHAAAIQLLSKVMPSPKDLQNQNKFQRWNALLASACFAAGLPNDARKHLANSPKLVQHKASWNLPLRLLEIMILIEMRQFDATFAQTETFRKHLNLLPENHSNRKRYGIILKLIKHLQNSGFHFQKIQESKKDLLTKLEPEYPETGWNLLSGELNPFHEWFRKKAAMGFSTKFTKG